MRVLVVNAGSSSLKLAVVAADSAQVLSRCERRWEPGADPGAHAGALHATLDELSPA